MRLIAIYLLAVTTLLCCAGKEKELLRITASRKVTDGNAIQNIIYTRKYEPLADEASLAAYMEREEIQQALTSNRKFYFYKDVISTEDFKVIVLMSKEFYNSDSAYYYQIRTYAADGKPIDKMDFAIWDEQRNVYCSSALTTPKGSVSKLLKIRRTCGDRTEVYQITREGRFVVSSAPDDGIIGSL